MTVMIIAVKYQRWSWDRCSAGGGS